MNRENLLKLADYLEGPLQARFDMTHYDDQPGACEDRRETCGTVGCAVGHGPYAGIKKIIDEKWNDYIARVFDVHVFRYDTFSSSREYLFLFGSYWSQCHNSPKDTASRIRYFVNHGIPSSWDNDFTWAPPAEVKPEPKERIVYVTVDKQVRQLQKELRDN